MPATAREFSDPLESDPSGLFGSAGSLPFRRFRGRPFSFGAVIKKNKSLPVLPTSFKCHKHFSYRQDGGVDGRTEAGSAAISILKLDHPTLCGWRQNAIDVWLDEEILQSREDLVAVISAIQTVVDERLPEFSFVIEAIALCYLE